MKKTKTFYSIMKTEAEVQQFITTYNEDIKPTLPEAMKQLEHKTDADRNQFADILTAELDKLAGNIYSTLTYARSHADDGQSLLAKNDDVISELKTIKIDIKNTIDSISRIGEYSKTSSIFANLANGIIPLEYTARPDNRPADRGSPDATES